VIGLDHVSVGEIDDVLIGGDQAGVVVVRTGGFLGLGGKLVALPFDCTPSGLVRQIGAIQEGRISGSS
jgi:hypothetical protein